MMRLDFGFQCLVYIGYMAIVGSCKDMVWCYIHRGELVRYCYIMMFVVEAPIELEMIFVSVATMILYLVGHGSLHKALLEPVDGYLQLVGATKTFCGKCKH